MKRKISVVTASRAEFGLLCGLIKEIESSSDLELELVVTGMHLLPEFGSTYKEIEKEGLIINKKINMDLASDSEIHVSKAIGGLIGDFTKLFNETNPDLIVILGDRYEIFSVAFASMISRKPIAHIHGGESTEGAIDESIRHSITKMSHLHFTSAKEYSKRIVQLGENPKTVFDVGALCVDNINNTKLLSREELEKSLGFQLGRRNLLITYHPVTLEKFKNEEQFKNLLLALEALNETKLLFTKSNIDMEGQIINGMIDKFVMDNPSNSISFTSMGKINYLSAIKHVDGVVGNSSSGIMEVPSFKKGTINIGDRQKGRIRSTSIIDCEPSTQDISSAINYLYSKPFQVEVLKTVSPFGKGGTAKKIIEIIRTFPLENILKKEFFDLNK